MEFKKDYINYLFFKAIYEGNGGLKDDIWLRNIADKIISVDDMVKLTYMVGKTAGLEPLFKYMLYISDKIDKSQVSIFNLKDNFEYDTRKLKKIIRGIVDYKSHKFEEKIEIAKQFKEEEIAPVIDSIKIDVTEDNAEPAGKEGMTLVENYDDSGEGEVFELENINETVETTGTPDDKLHTAEDTIGDDEPETEEAGKEIFEISDIEDEAEEEIEEEPQIETIAKTEPEKIEAETITEAPEPVQEDSFAEIEIVVKKPSELEGQVKEESVTNEAYYTFETKFFEEVKILEKLFATVDREGKNAADDKLSEKSLQSLTEIIEITSELLNLSRQLMFDLIADVFLTMNLYFTKAIGNPEIIESEKIKLFDSALALVNSLIRGEDYLNYDIIVDKIEKLKAQLRGPEEEPFKEQTQKEVETEEVKEEPALQQAPVFETAPDIIKPAEINADSALFKLKYLVKEFEKSF